MVRRHLQPEIADMRGAKPEEVFFVAGRLWRVFVETLSCGVAGDTWHAGGSVSYLCCAHRFRPGREQTHHKRTTLMGWQGGGDLSKVLGIRNSNRGCVHLILCTIGVC